MLWIVMEEINRGSSALSYPVNHQKRMSFPCGWAAAFWRLELDRKLEITFEGTWVEWSSPNGVYLGHSKIRFDKIRSFIWSMVTCGNSFPFQVEAKACSTVGPPTKRRSWLTVATRIQRRTLCNGVVFEYSVVVLGGSPTSSRFGNSYTRIRTTADFSGSVTKDLTFCSHPFEITVDKTTPCEVPTITFEKRNAPSTICDNRSEMRGPRAGYKGQEIMVWCYLAISHSLY